MSEQRLSDTDIVDWIIAESNRYFARFDGAREDSWFDLHIAGNATIGSARPGTRLTREALEAHVFRHTVETATKKLLS